VTFDGKRKGDDRVNGALGDGVAGEKAVLGIPKGSLSTANVFLSCGELAYSPLLVYKSVREKITRSLLVDHPAGSRVKGCSVSHAVS
jgi:hypothetical protein